MRGQDRLYSQCRYSTPAGLRTANGPPRISLQYCPPSHGELAGDQQEPHCDDKHITETNLLTLSNNVYLMFYAKEVDLGT